jgi:uncharacterized protein (TIGR02266 family)
LADPNTRQGKRTPVTLKIKFKSETLEQFIERYAVDVSQGGIFIRTKEPLSVGTQMKFEFQLRDASPLIAGEGTVVWTRENDPSRPAIAPGMGVRFDRLADGSQGILERILTEKAKQAPQRPALDTSKPPLFTDTPTRVAPAPVQDALLGRDSGRGRRGDDSAAHLDSHTPLPRPMPFHSDADEFPDEAFEEATKVRALDELIAQTADADHRGENTSRRPNGRADATVTDPIPDRAERAEQMRPTMPTILPAQSELQDVPDLPNPPDFGRPQPRMLDTSPSPRIDSMPPPLPEALAKTRLGVEPARARVTPSNSPPPPLPLSAPPPSSPSISPPGSSSGPGSSPSPFSMPQPSSPLPFAQTSELPPLPSGMRAVAHEQTEPARMPELKSRSIAPLLILIFLGVAAGGAAVWFFILRPQVTERDHGSAATATAGSGSAGSATPTGTGATATGTAGATGATAPAAGSPTATAAAPKGEIAETEITANVDGATVEIPGTDQSGPAPFSAKLEKGKPYKARIAARGFAALELDLKGGDAKLAAKLVPKPRILMIASDPSGAQISIDGQSTGHATPFEIELNAPSATKKSVRVVLRKSGFRAVDRTIEFAKFADDDTRMTAKLDEKLVPAPVTSTPPTPRPGSGAKPAGQGSGDTGSGTGSDATPPAGNGSAPRPSDRPVTTPSGSAPPPAPAPPAPSGNGSTSGSAEPEPDFNKPK